MAFGLGAKGGEKSTKEDRLSCSGTEGGVWAGAAPHSEQEQGPVGSSLAWGRGRPREGSAAAPWRRDAGLPACPPPTGHQLFFCLS